MPKRPGGELASRPLHFFWLCDTSGSMSYEGKIQTLNFAIREALPHMQDIAHENPHANVLIWVMSFSHGASWITPQPIQVDKFRWKDLIADPVQSPAVDVVFLMDTSGSMGNEISAVKRSCTDFSRRIIREGAQVRLGLVGFAIGGLQGKSDPSFRVRDLSRYTIGIWPLSTPEQFQANIKSLKLRKLGGTGCYLANKDTVDVFPPITRVFNGPKENRRILVIVSDEIGDSSGVSQIVRTLRTADIKTHVLGVKGESRAHQSIAEQTGGKFWDIKCSKGSVEFGSLLEKVAGTIAKETVQNLKDGTLSSGTDLGAALQLLAEQLQIPPMTERALPPVLVLISDGQPTDEFNNSLDYLMRLQWGKKAVRIAIAIGQDADQHVLQKFIGRPEIRPLLASSPELLVRYIRWVSTAVLQSASAPSSLATTTSGSNVYLTQPPQGEDIDLIAAW